MPKLIIAAHYLPIDTQDAFVKHEKAAVGNNIDGQYMNGNGGESRNMFRGANSRPPSFYGDDGSAITMDVIDEALGRLKASDPDIGLRPTNPMGFLAHIRPRRTHSTLYSAIRHLESTETCVWVGIPSLDVPGDCQDILAKHLADQFRCYPVFVDHTQHHGHYDVYCKTVLWPVLHYIVWDRSSNIQMHKEAFSKYCAVNELFAKRIIELYEPGDDSKSAASQSRNVNFKRFSTTHLVWIHDYHLFLVPDLIRRKLPLASIGFFLHVPFPSSELFRCLPRKY
jgi:trehalose-6-phosphate synthase